MYNLVDLVVGAYKSDAAVILYTHPPLTLTVTSKSAIQVIAKDTNTFTMEVCFQYGGQNLNPDVGRYMYLYWFVEMLPFCF